MTHYEKLAEMSIEEMAKVLVWEEQFALFFPKIETFRITNRHRLDLEYEGSVWQKVIENE